MFPQTVNQIISDNEPTITAEYINICQSPTVQCLKVDLTLADLVLTKTGEVKCVSDISDHATSREDLVWLPKLDQLLRLLRRNIPDPDGWVLREDGKEWSCIVTISEWAADYETTIDVQRQFVDTEPKLVVMQALLSALGVGERWMV